jgi:hypothetical protein
MVAINRHRPQCRRSQKPFAVGFLAPAPVFAFDPFALFIHDACLQHCRGTLPMKIDPVFDLDRWHFTVATDACGDLTSDRFDVGRHRVSIHLSETDIINQFLFPLRPRLRVRPPLLAATLQRRRARANWKGAVDVMVDVPESSSCKGKHFGGMTGHKIRAAFQFETPPLLSLTSASVERGAGFSPAATPLRRNQARSKRSAFITLVQAATKSLTNFSLASPLA